MRVFSEREVWMEIYKLDPYIVEAYHKFSPKEVQDNYLNKLGIKRETHEGA